ncbi:glycosyltransferase [Algoriphagus mannitolivorans]|uniref:glycosyltransferase n=1 Tax=Algoriphagus mannitolivorans TaxID=226504 RepID=UPI00040C3D97|nr:glycosyltransferase [Algoriphagus mannitolivorans]
MICFYLIWCFGYFLTLAWLSKYWPSKTSAIKPEGSNSQLISLIIPFRNESDLVSQLIQELQKISDSVHEIIVVDDQSEDDSWVKFSLAAEKLPNLRVLRSPGLGKKAALEFGILQAKGSLIVTSDADCMFSETWVSELTSYFENSQIQLVAGPVISEGLDDNFFTRFQQFEWVSILLLTQFTFQKGNPLMCSGANLAFRKSAFEHVNGYSGNEHLLSGDDEFLLKKIHREFGTSSCHYIPTGKALVKTLPQASWKALINQRVRWAGKWKLHRSLAHSLATLFAFFIQLGWVASVFLWFGGKLSILEFLGIWILKFMAESWAFLRVLRSFGLSFSLLALFWTSLIHPFYVIWVGISTIQGKFTWKGRSN